MTLEDAVGRVLTEFWDEVWPAMDPTRREDLARLVRELTLQATNQDAANLCLAPHGVIVSVPHPRDRRHRASPRKVPAGAALSASGRP